MRAEAGGARTVSGSSLAELARDAQAPRLVQRREAVAGLDLERWSRLRPSAPARAGGRRSRAGPSPACARGGDRRADAAAGAGDVFVAGAFEAQLELARALAAVDQVGVAVDQPGRDQLAVEMVLGIDRESRRQVGVGADPAQDARRRPRARRGG